MSNITYSKEVVILEAVNTILISDVLSTGNEVKSIKNYVDNRVYRTYTEDKNNTNKFMPQLNMEMESMETNPSLPTGEYILTIKAFINQDASRPKDILDNLMARVCYLLDKKEKNLNNSSNKNLRCVRCRKYSLIDNNDYLNKAIYGKQVIFTLKCMDEILDNL
jgi:hypothetical protein